MEPTKEQLQKAFDQAPKSIQDALTDGRAVDFMSRIRSRYNLHVDVAGKVIETIRNMLLGFVTPTEFITALVNLGLNEGLAEKITGELNREVFIPLRDEVRGESASVPIARGANLPQVSPPIIKARSEPVPDPITVSLPAPAVPSTPPPFNLIRPDALAPAVPAYQDTPAMQVRTMQHDIEVVQQGGQRTYEYPLAKAPHPSQVTPARSFQTASVPYTSTPAYSRPLQETPVQAPAPAPLPPPPTAPYIAQPPQTPTDYSSDPYREPI